MSATPPSAVSFATFAVAAGLVLGAAGSARAQAAEPAPPPEAPADPAAPDAAKQEPQPPTDSRPSPGPAEPPAPKNYVTALVGTTLFYVGNDGTTDSFLGDISIGAGYGRLVTPTIAVELDVVPTLVDGKYDNTVLIPGAVWSFSTRFYAAARFLVKIDPEFNLTVFPGIGAVYSFSNGLGFSLELNMGSTIGKGEPDFAVALTPGVLYSF